MKSIAICTRCELVPRVRRKVLCVSAQRRKEVRAVLSSAVATSRMYWTAQK